MRKWFIIKPCYNRVIWFTQTYCFNNALWFIVINWYNRLHDSFKTYVTYSYFTILSDNWIHYLFLWINGKIMLQILLLFRWYQMIHPMSIGSLLWYDTIYIDDSIGECWYKFPFLSHYILYDTIYYIDSIKSVVTVILSDSL